MTENTILMGYRGSQFLEAGAVYAPYVPLMMTPLVYDPNTFTPRKGIMLATEITSKNALCIDRKISNMHLFLLLELRYFLNSNNVKIE